LPGSNVPTLRCKREILSVAIEMHNDLFTKDKQSQDFVGSKREMPPNPRHHLSLAFRGCFADLLRSNPPSGISLVLNVNCQLILGTNHEYCSLSDCDVPPEVQRQRPRRRPDLPILMSGPRVHLAFDELDYPWSATESLLYYQKDLVLLNHIPQDVEH